jgi:hypothetical protein
MIITANLFLTKNIKEEDVVKYAGDIATYITHVDKLIIFNMFKNKNKEDMGISKFFEYIARYKNIEVATCDNLGEVYNYKRAMLQAEKDNADYTVILEQDYFYDDDAFLTLKRKLLEWDKDTFPCVLSPYPKTEAGFHEIYRGTGRYLQSCPGRDPQWQKGNTLDVVCFSSAAGTRPQRYGKNLWPDEFG